MVEKEGASSRIVKLNENKQDNIRVEIDLLHQPEGKVRVNNESNSSMRGLDDGDVSPIHVVDGLQNNGTTLHTFQKL